MRKISVILILVFAGNGLFAQGELDVVGKNMGLNERTFALLFNSNGWGVNFRYGKRLDGFKKRLYEVDFVGIKHAKETKSYNEINLSQKKFVYGKVNQFYNLRLGIGTQKEIFSKADKGGIAIKYFYSVGVNIGFLKPIYYEVAYPYPEDYRIYYLVIEKYDFYKQHNEGSVYSKASFFEGINETKIEPGLYIKAGINFDISASDEKVNAIEAGIVVDIFTREIPIMATQENNMIFPTLFVNYRFGRTINKRLKNIE